MWMDIKGEIVENTEGEEDVEGFICDGRHGHNEALWTFEVKEGVVLPNGDVFYFDEEEKENESVEKKEFGRREKEQENVNNVAEEMPEDVEDDHESVNNGMDVEDVEDDIEIDPEDEERERANVDFAVRETPEDVEDDEDLYDAYCERDYNGMEYDEEEDTDPEEEERGRAVNIPAFDEAMEEVEFSREEEEDDEEESEDDDEMSEDYGVNLKDTEDVVDLKQDLEGFPEDVHGQFWYKVNVSEEADDVDENESENDGDQSESSSEDDEGSEDEVMDISQPLEDVNEREKEVQEQHEDIPDSPQHIQEPSTTSEIAQTSEVPEKSTEDVKKNNTKGDSDVVPMEIDEDAIVPVNNSDVVVTPEVEEYGDQPGQQQQSEKNSTASEKSTPSEEVAPKAVHTKEQLNAQGAPSEISGGVKGNDTTTGLSKYEEDVLEYFKCTFELIKENPKLYARTVSNIKGYLEAHENALKKLNNKGKRSRLSLPEKDVKTIKKMVKDPLSEKNSTASEKPAPSEQVSPEVVEEQMQAQGTPRKASEDVEGNDATIRPSEDVAEHVQLSSLKTLNNEKKRSRSSLSEKDVKIIKKMVKEEVKLKFDEQFANIGELFIQFGNSLKGISGTSSSEGQNSGDVPEKDKEDDEMRED